MEECYECEGTGKIEMIGGYVQTGWGYGDCHEREIVVECEDCDGTGEVEISYKIVGDFGFGVTKTLADGFDTHEAAHAEAKRLWFTVYNEGRSEHTPRMGHSSGILSIGVREDL